jgi:hypothetical protein
MIRTSTIQSKRKGRHGFQERHFTSPEMFLEHCGVKKKKGKKLFNSKEKRTIILN